MTRIALLVDDACPLVHVYRYHRADTGHRTQDGREPVETIPHRFLDDFCSVCERREMAGKLSIMPAPVGRRIAARGGFEWVRCSELAAGQ